jgi:hypothetical protein
MNRFYVILYSLAAVAALGACDSHSWDKETSKLFQKKGGHSEKTASHAPAVQAEHATSEKKSVH